MSGEDDADDVTVALQTAVARFRKKHDPNHRARAKIDAHVKRDLLQGLQEEEPKLPDSFLWDFDFDDGGQSMRNDVVVALRSRSLKKRQRFTRVCIFKDVCTKLATTMGGTVRFVTRAYPMPDSAVRVYHCRAHFRFLEDT